MSTTATVPPRLAKHFLHWALPDELKEPVLGDLEEEFLFQLQTNPSKASAWYRRQALKSGWQFIQKTKRGLLMFLFSLFIFVGLTYMAMALGGGISMFIDTPSVLIVFPAAISFTIAASSWAKFTQAFQHLLNQDQNQTESELVLSKQVFTMLGNISLWLGGAMTVVGWVGLLLVQT